MKRWIDQTQVLLDWVTEAEGALCAIRKLISEEESPVSFHWQIAVSESLPDGLTLENLKESLSSLRDKLATLVRMMRERK